MNSTHALLLFSFLTFSFVFIFIDFCCSHTAKIRNVFALFFFTFFFFTFFVVVVLFFNSFF